MSRGRMLRNSSIRSTFTFQPGGSCQRIGPSFDSSRCARGRKFISPRCASFSLIMCVMKRLPLTAYRKSGGVASRRRFVRELIEGVVQLDRVEVAHVMLEHLRRLRAGRIV